MMLVIGLYSSTGPFLDMWHTLATLSHWVCEDSRLGFQGSDHRSYSRRLPGAPLERLIGYCPPVSVARSGVQLVSEALCS